MSVFEQELHDAFNESEKIETTAKEVENRIKSIEGASQYIPKRPYGTPVNGQAMSMTLKYLINSKDRQLAAYLNIADGTFKKMEEAETARQQQIERMKQQTEELAYKNQMKSQQRQKDMLWNQTHPIGQKRILR
jgi:hypothetical protein|tara:strand:- start:1195 stop:1596 length:402 start_codon:yes stop_codon:yes gene_type:complete